MAIRKFLISYGPKGVQTREVPSSKEEFKKQPAKSSADRATAVQVKQGSSGGAQVSKPDQSLLPAPKKHQPGPNRTLQAAQKCLALGQTDPGSVEAMVRKLYAGSDRSERYILGAIQHALRVIKKSK